MSYPNLPFAQWPKTFAQDERMIGALLDRLTHRAEILAIEGDSTSRLVTNGGKVMTAAVRGIGLVAFVVICLGAGAVGGIVTGPEIEGWYRTLEKPSWQPPDWVFGPVWTTLYLMMAVAAWLIWKPAGLKAAAFPLGMFGFQLVLNVGWSWIFFGLHRPGWALVELVALWLAILLTTWAFFRRSWVTGWLMVPYLAWVSFAGALNYEIWRLN